MHLFTTAGPRLDTTNPTGRHHLDPHLDPAYQNLEDPGLDVSDIPIALRQPPPLFSRSYWARSCITTTVGLDNSNSCCRPPIEPLGASSDQQLISSIPIPAAESSRSQQLNLPRRLRNSTTSSYHQHHYGGLITLSCHAGTFLPASVGP